MERLRFHGMTWGDASLMRERLAHQTLHDLGMLISRVAGALLHVNGVEYGIFNLVEVIDEPFLKSRGLQGTLMWEAWMAYTDARSYDDKIVVGAQPLGLYGIGASFNPPWFYLPTQAERQTLCNVRNPAGVTHFTCDPVGHVMTIAWRRVFFDYIRKYLRTDMSAIPPVSVLQQANRYASLWSGQYR
ncbi:unnamed protein product, partial [Prorocentrum cordatum]